MNKSSWHKYGRMVLRGGSAFLTPLQSTLNHPHPKRSHFRTSKVGSKLQVIELEQFQSVIP